MGESFRSDPLIGIAELSSTSAMPLMPIPPIPVKCRCCLRKNIYLLYCFGLRVPCQSKLWR